MLLDLSVVMVVVFSRNEFCKIVSRLGARERVVTAWVVVAGMMSGVVGGEVEGAGVVMRREIS